MSDKNTFSTDYDINVLDNPVIAQAVADKVADEGTAINFKDGKMTIASAEVIEKMGDVVDKLDSFSDKLKDDTIKDNLKDVFSAMKSQPETNNVNNEILNAASFEIPGESPIASAVYAQSANPDTVKQQLAAIAELNNLNPTPEQIAQLGQAVDAQELSGAAQEAKPVLGEHTQRMINEASQQQQLQGGREF